MLTERASGILLHVSSLPSRGGVGDLGPAAYAFADFLAAAKQQYWQVLPVTPTGYGNSPYSALSAFAGNSLFISMERLASQGWVEPGDLNALPSADGPAEYEVAAACKRPLLSKAALAFLSSAPPQERERFEAFCRDNAAWLDDYARFTVLRGMFPEAGWTEWPAEFARRSPEALQKLDTEHARELMTEKVVQFFFNDQWRDLRGYCLERGVRFIGDMAIFVSHDSADVWTHPDLFELDADGNVLHVAGVPPDYFSPTGQRWGNPLYRWNVMLGRKFEWWTARIRRALSLCDLLRLDHFRGFEAYWSIPARDENAVGGEWMKAPGSQLFAALLANFGDLPLIAEDLGLITPEVDRLRTSFGMPGMRVMQFGFSDRGAHIHLPHRLEENMVIYTGTHDNNTTLGWWNQASDAERQAVVTYLHPADDGVVWAMMRSAAASVARLCLIPMQDVLQLGAEARMNTPAKAAGNWSWRYSPHALQPAIAEKLSELTAMTDRDVCPRPGAS